MGNTILPTQFAQPSQGGKCTFPGMLVRHCQEAAGNPSITRPACDVKTWEKKIDSRFEHEEGGAAAQGQSTCSACIRSKLNLLHLQERRLQGARPEKDFLPTTLEKSRHSGKTMLATVGRPMIRPQREDQKLSWELPSYNSQQYSFLCLWVHGSQKFNKCNCSCRTQGVFAGPATAEGSYRASASEK